MKPGQTTVLGLLIVLLALEAVRNKPVHDFLSTWLGGFVTAITRTETAKDEGVWQGQAPTPNSSITQPGSNQQTLLTTSTGNGFIPT